MSGTPDIPCKENPTGDGSDSSRRGQVEIFSDEATFSEIRKIATKKSERENFSVALASENMKSVNSLRSVFEKQNEIVVMRVRCEVRAGFERLTPKFISVSFAHAWKSPRIGVHQSKC